jgi:hypothetical protein
LKFRDSCRGEWWCSCMRHCTTRSGGTVVWGTTPQGAVMQLYEGTAPHGVVVQLFEALRHKTGGSGFDSQWGSWKFSSDLVPLAAFSSLWVHSACMITMELPWRVKCSQHMDLTALPY